MKKTALLLITILTLSTACSKKEKNRFYDKAGFSIKFPSSWEIEKNKQGVNVIASNPASKYMNFKSNINIIVSETKNANKDLTLQQHLDLNYKELKRIVIDLKVIDKGLMKIGNYNSAFLLVEHQIGTKTLKTLFNIFIKDNKIYTITFLADEKEFDATKKYYDKSLNSFRFE